MLLAVIAVLALATGKLAGIGRRARVPGTLDVSSEESRWNYLRIVFLPLTLLGILPQVSSLAGGAQQQILVDLFQTVPLMICFLLLLRILTTGGGRFDKLLVIGYLAVVMVSGVASGALAGWLFPAVGVALIYVGVRRRVPRTPIILLLLFLLFFQPSKQAFRETFVFTGAGQQSAGILTRAQAFVSLASSTWIGALTGQGTTTPIDLVRSTINRASLLTTVAHVIDYTPSVVPYQYGSTYAYLPVSLVPRFIWPDKPSINDANQFYQNAYGVTNAQESHNNISISVGVPAEGFMNFGWLGVIIVMFLFGILFDWVESTFLSPESGDLFTAFGIVIVLQLILIESQTGVYVSGLVQKAFVVAIVLLPALRRTAPEGEPRTLSVG
jgi:hypothetical protein